MRIPTYLIAALGLITIGTGAVLNPRQSSREFGLPTKDRSGLGFVTGCGTRDVAIGLLLLTSDKSRRLPLVIVGALALADLLTVSSTSEDPPLPSLRNHGIGLLGALALAILTKKEATDS